MKFIKKGSSHGPKANKLRFVKLEDISFEPPIHSLKDIEMDRMREDNVCKNIIIVQRSLILIFLYIH